MDEKKLSSKTVVTSAEFTRQFGHLRQSSSDDPVFITHHGRETHVLMTVAAFRAHRADPGGGAAPAMALPSVARLAGWIHEGCLILDEQLTIVHANDVAHAMVDHDEGTLIGRQLYEAIPELEGSLVQSYVTRSVAGREPVSADLPSLFRKGGWVRLEIFPSMRNTTVLFSDITDDVKTNRMADSRKTIVEAARLHGGIGSISINPRAQIEDANAAMCAMLKLPRERLQGVPVTDLVPMARRVAFRERLETTLRGQGAQRIDSEFLANDGKAIAVRIGIGERRGAYGAEGAILIVTLA